MLTIQEFTTLLEARRTLVIDGALATELEIRGHDLNHALWSAKVLREDPESIKAVHLDYFLAGADIAITSSYQAGTRGLTDHFGVSEDEGKALIRRSVEVAHQAREEAYRSGVDADRKLLIAGSVGPFGAFLADGSEYRGDYVRSSEEFKEFHRPRIQALIDGGVDLLALETIPCMLEIRALVELLVDDFPTAIAWLSCTVRDASSLCDSAPWEEVVDVVRSCSQIVGLGVNCVPMDIAVDALKSLHALTSLPLVCVSQVPGYRSTIFLQAGLLLGDFISGIFIRPSHPSRRFHLLISYSSSIQTLAKCSTQ